MIHGYDQASKVKQIVRKHIAHKTYFQIVSLTASIFSDTWA